MTMEDKAYRALVASIKHWAENALAEKPGDAYLGASHCALCKEYATPAMACGITDGRCNGCPVKEKTGYDGCRGSPYNKAERAHSLWIAETARVEVGYPIANAKKAKADYLIKAHAELMFLIGLLPVERPVEWNDVEPVKWEEAVKAAEAVDLVRAWMDMEPEPEPEPEPTAPEPSRQYIINIPALNVGEEYSLSVKRKR